MIQTSKICVCGKEFITSKAQQIYCSVKCRIKKWSRYSIKKVKENPNYGNTKIHRESKNYKLIHKKSQKNYREKKPLIIKEYNKTWRILNAEKGKYHNSARRNKFNKGLCESCGSEDNLHVHHDKYTHKIKDTRTLCSSCHKKHHIKLGVSE